MIKKLLLTIVVAIACMSMAQGQALVQDNGYFKRNTLTPLTYMPKVPKAPMKALGENQMYMGPYVGDALAEYGLGLTGLPGTYKICAFLPLDLVQNFEGGTVKSIRFGLCAPVTEAAVYLIPVTKLSPFTAGTPVIEQAVKSTTSGWNEVQISAPYTIDTEGTVGFLLGYKYKQLSGSTDACYPISAVMEGTIYTTYMYGVQGSTSWQDLGLGAYGNLSVQAVVESENFQDYNLNLNSLVCDEFGSIEKGLNYVLTMSNVGVATLNDYKLDLLVDGNVVKTLDSPVALTQTASQYNGVLPLDGIEPGHHTFTIRAVEAAGEEVTDQEVSSDFVVYTFAYPRQKQLVEHFTSQGCTYCYLGDAVLTALDRLRGDLAWVSIHGNLGVTDIFNTTKCEQIMSYLECTGFPSASFNRHPYDGELSPGLGYNISYAQQVAQMLSDEALDANPTPALANIDLSATFDPETRKLDVTVAGEATTDFSTIYGQNVAITVYLTEDSLVARQYSNNSWIQNFVHDHVMRDVISKSVYGDPINWTGETTYSNTFSTTLNSAWRSEKMHIVAFINRTGSGNKDVINAEIIDMKDVGAPVEPALYLLGSFNEWSQDNMEPLTLGEDGKWTITKEMEANAEFKLMDEAGNWLGAITEGDNFIVTEEQVNDSIELSLTTPGMNFQIPVAGTWTLTVDKENNKMLITGEWPVPYEEPALYILGPFNEWGQENMDPLTFGEDGKWTITKEMEANVEFKLMDEAGNWLGGITEGDNFIVTEEQVTDSIELSLTTPGANFQIPVAGTWTLIVDKENNTMIITGEWVEPIPEPTHIYILGEVNENEWAPNVGVEMSTENDTIFNADIAIDGRHDGYNYFSFTKKLAEEENDWASIAPYRFTVVSEGNFIMTDELYGQPIPLDADGVNYDNAIQIPAGEYNLTINLEEGTLVINKNGSAGLLGDFDNSGIVDVEDVNAAINIILKLNTMADYPGNGDMDANGIIDVEDVNAIINIILKLV